MKTLYWQWYGLNIPCTFWRQSSRLHDRRRVLDLHEECPF